MDNILDNQCIFGTAKITYREFLKKMHELTDDTIKNYDAAVIRNLSSDGETKQEISDYLNDFLVQILLSSALNVVKIFEEIKK